MHPFFVQLVDALFPPRNETLMVRGIQTEKMRSLFRPHVAYDVTALSHFSDPQIRALLHEAKFYGNKKAQVLLAELPALFLLEGHQFDFLIPVPLSRERMHKRGYNQVMEILRARDIALPILENHLVRTRDTTPQTSLDRAAREKNMHGAFAIKNSEIIAGKHILIVDDVVTTGATLRAAKAALLPYSPTSITCLALAH